MSWLKSNGVFTNCLTGQGTVLCPVYFFTANLKLFCSFSIKFITFYTKTENRPLSCSKYSEALSYALKPIGGYRTGFLFLWQEEAIPRGRHAMTPSPHKPMDLSNNFCSELEYFRKFYTHSERIVPRHRTVPVLQSRGFLISAFL